MNEPWYQRVFPLTRISRIKNTEFEVTTTQQGFRLATSIDGPLTGRGGDIIIIDDPLKPAEALSDSRREGVNKWFSNTLVSRLDNVQAGAIIIVMQRLHEDDLSGTQLRSPEPWVQLKLPAIAEEEERVPIGHNEYHIRRAGDVLHPERVPRSFLESLRSGDPETFAAHYQQTPIPPGGIIIQRKWVRYYDGLPRRTSSSLIIQSWDTASKAGESNDWSVCTTWLLQENKYYLMDLLRDRLDFPTLRTRAIAHARRYNANKILIEAAGVGMGLVAEMKAVGLAAISVKPGADKKSRMKIQLRNSKAAWYSFRNKRRGLPILRPSSSLSRTLVLMTKSTAPLRLWPAATPLLISRHWLMAWEDWLRGLRFNKTSEGA
jgi:terminase large subunit-like protein